MEENEISINRIDLHSRGIPPEIARSALDGLGQEVMHNLVQQGVVNPGQMINLGDINLEKLILREVGDARELRREIASVLTKAIAARIGRK